GGNYTLINITKNWCQALQYCRVHFDDLANINDKRQNENAIKEGKNTNFWIGLMFDEWEWEDGSCSSFRKWNPIPKAVEQWLQCTDVGGPFWIGLRQSHVFGFWIWSDRMVSYCNWKNDTVLELPKPGSAVYNHCGAIDKMDSKWSDEDCSDRKPFLCEEEIVFMNK
uniref:C-type lectin domain-containing protein n=1 Tax=Cyclopterus lumpus TaxID=8103 RepID=A0A8C2ZTU8_CYCLU